MKLWCGIIYWYKADDGTWMGGHNKLTISTELKRSPKYCCIIHFFYLNWLIDALVYKFGVLNNWSGNLSWNHQSR